MDDPRAVELSGLVATADGYVAVVDSQFDPDDIRIVYLDPGCAVRRTQSYPTAARDPEDLARAPDGTLWVADIGDNVTAQTRRSTIALWRIPDGGAPVIHRLTYPDGPHDAEALLFDGDGTPIVVTKELSGTAQLYRATAPLVAGSTPGVPLTRVGEFRPPVAGVANPLGGIGELVVTGAAASPDGHRVALRTYAAAYEWDVPDGDVVRAITTGGPPRVTPLPNEPQGEAIAYTMDGNAFLTLSDEAGPTELRRYTPSTVVASPPATAAAPSTPSDASTVDWKLWIGGTAFIGGVLTLAVVAILAIRRARPRSH